MSRADAEKNKVSNILIAKKIIEDNKEELTPNIKKGLLKLLEAYNQTAFENRRILANKRLIEQDIEILDKIAERKRQIIDKENTSIKDLQFLYNSTSKSLSIKGVDKYKRDVSSNLRFKILYRDNFTCTYCGAKSPDASLQVDHMKPFSKGGLTKEDNLTTACFDCNIGKSNKFNTQDNERQ